VELCSEAECGSLKEAGGDSGLCYGARRVERMQQ
jgi:hypothetical protein